MSTKSKPARALLSGIVLGVFGAAFACAKTSTPTGVELQIVVGSNVDTAQIASLEFYLDELSGASALFSVSSLVPQNQVLGGINYAITTEDADGDAKFELLFKVSQNVFLTTNALTVSLLSNPLAVQFQVVARVKNASGTVIGSGTSSATNFANPSPSISINVCANGVCASADGGALADAGVDAGADAGADAGVGADAGADAGVDAGADAGTGLDAGTAKSWDAAVEIEAEQDVCTAHRVGIDSLGNAVVIFRRGSAGAHKLMSNRYLFASAAWSGVATIATPVATTSDFFYPALAVTPSGRAYAVYRFNHTAPPGMNVWGNVMESTGAWDASVNFIGNISNESGNPTLAVNANQAGFVVTAMSGDAGSPIKIYATTLTAGTWSTTGDEIETGSIAEAVGPRVAVSDAGIGVAVWLRRPAANDPPALAFNRYGQGGWGTAGLFPGNAYNDAGQPAIAASPGGVFVVAFPATNAGRSALYAISSLNNGASWSAPVLIDSEQAAGQNSEKVSVGIDTNGNGIAVWRQWSGTKWNVWANRFASADGGTWGTAEIIEANTTNVDDPALDVGLNGHAAAVWLVDNGGGTFTEVWANVYTPQSGWGTAVRLFTSGFAIVLPKVAVDPNGNAVAVWEAIYGFPSIFSSVYR